MKNQPDSAINDVVTRREFTVQSALAILSGVVITVSGCDEDSTPMSPTPNDVPGSVSSNHAPPHVVTVTAAQITAGTEVTLTLTGTPTHSHTVVVAQADLATGKAFLGAPSTITDSTPSVPTSVL